MSAAAESIRGRIRARPRHALAVLGAALVALVLLAADKGAVEISVLQCIAIVGRQLGLALPWAFTPEQAATLLHIRLPRVLLGVAVGAGLGASGAAMQGIFRNPLADPSLVGVSSGAALAATFVIIVGDAANATGIATIALPIGAFAGGLATTWIVYRLSIVAGQTVVSTMLLAGIAVNALAQAFSGLLTYVATDTQIRSITFWKLGSLGGSTWTTLASVAPLLVVPVVALPFLAKPLNAMLLGEAEAGHLGVDVQHVKRLAVALVALAVGASVAAAGIIVFVGLVVPHVARLVFGPDHRRVLPASTLLGAILLLGADLVARTVVAPAELPIGVLTAIAGAPFFLWLLLRDRARGAVR